MRRRSVAALLAGAALVLVACGDDAGTTSPTTTAAQAVAVPAEVPATTGDCEALESYEPTFELPEPGGQMPAGSRMAEIQAYGRLRVGVSADTLLFGFRNPITGQIEGFDVDVLRAVADAIFGPRDLAAGEPDNIEFRVINYAQRLPSLTDGDVDLVAHTMTINCERWQTIAFSTEYFTAGQNLLVRTSADGSGPKTPDDLVGPDHKVCVADGSTNIQTMRSEYPDVQLEVVDDLTDCLVLFQQSAVDAITGDNTVMAGFAAQDPYGDADTELFTSEPYGVGVSHDYPELVEFVNLVLEEMREDGRLLDLGVEWLGAEQPIPPAVYGRQPG